MWLEVYRSDLAREFEFRLAEVDNVLQQFENRDVRFFDDTLRVGQLPDLVNKARIQREFERDVVADLRRRIESQVHELIDWMVASALRQWEAVTEQVNRRRLAHEGRIVGGQASGFHYDRAKLIATVGRAATGDRQLRSRARVRRHGRRRACRGRGCGAGAKWAPSASALSCLCWPRLRLLT